MKKLLLAALLLLAPAAHADSYGVGPGSKVTYLVKHSFHDVLGTTTAPRGVVQYDPAKPLDFSGIVEKPVQADWKSFSSDNANRDANVLAVVNAAKFPTLTFVIEAIEGAKQDGTVVTGTLRGRMYINGQKKPVQAPITIDVKDPAKLAVKTSFETPMTAYGLERPSLMFVAVDDNVGIGVELVFVKQ